MITILINAHNEGYLIRSAILSAYEAKLFSISREIKTQLIIVADSPDDDTLFFIKESRHIIDELHIVNYKDLGLSRNFGVEKTDSEYICFLDGDDLIEKDWPFKALQKYKNKENQNTIFHTEYFFGFGDEFFVRKQISSSDPSFSPLYLASNWYFCNNSFGPTRIYRNVPFKKSEHRKGFGAEDWWLSCETLALGISHDFVPGTIYYYRRRSNVVSLGSRKGITYGPTLLYSEDFFKKIKYKPVSKVKNKKRKLSLDLNLKSLLKGALSPHFFRLLSYTYHHIREYFLKLPTEKISMGDFERKLKSSWVNLQNEADLSLMIRDYDFRKIIHISNFPESGFQYVLYEVFDWYYKNNISNILVTGWITTGGADKVAKMLSAEFAASNDVGFGIIVTDSEKCELELPSLKVLNFAEVCNRHGLFDIDLKIKILTRLIVQTRPGFVWNINSFIYHESIKEYGLSLKNSSKQIVSVFGPGKQKDGSFQGFISSHLIANFHYYDLLVSDNEKIRNWFVKFRPDARDKFEVLYNSVPQIELNPKKNRSNDGRLRILWASRLDWDKRLDVLLKIIELIEKENLSVSIDIFGSPVLYDDHQFKQIINIRSSIASYKGEFKNFSHINESELYDIFLYTSHSDGFPNVVLEAVQQGLIVISSDVGGISELINPENGYLVFPPDDASTFVDSIKNFMSLSESEIFKMRKSAHMALNAQHSEDRFKSKLSELLIKASR